MRTVWRWFGVNECKIVSRKLSSLSCDISMSIGLNWFMFVYLAGLGINDPCMLI